MLFSKTILSAALMAVSAAVAAAETLQFLSVPTTVHSGQPVAITWTGGSGDAVTITLRKGNPSDLDTIGVLTNDATGGSWTWTPDSDLENASDYALDISQDGSADNYSNLFSLTGGTTVAASSSTASMTASASSSASAASSKSTAAASSSASASASSASASASKSASSASSASAASSASSTKSASSSSSSTSVPSSSGSMVTPVAKIAFAAVGMVAGFSLLI